MSQTTTKRITILLMFIFLFFIASNIFFTGDDWAWAGNEGLHRLKNWFSLYNGRYAGNIAELALTRIGLLRPFIMALTTTYIIVKIVSFTNKTYILYIITGILFLLMPATTFRETIAWTAGYSNYVFPIAIFLTYLGDIKRIIYDDYQPGIIKIIFMFLMAIIGQLFVENMTLYIAFAAIVICIYYYIKHRKINPYLLLYALGAVIGAVIMFSNDSYLQSLVDKEGYRTIGARSEDGLLLGAIKVYVKNITPILLYSFYLINLIISLLLTKHAKKISLFNYLGMLISFVVITNLQFFHIPIRLKILAILSVILILTNFYLIFKTNFNKNKIIQIAFLYFSAYAVIAPLVVVSPFGSRNFLFSYILLIIIILMMLEEFEFSSTITKIFITLLCALACQFGYYFIKNNIANNQRIACVKKQQRNQKSTYYLPRVPYERFVWTSDPVTKMYQRRFMAYYHIKPKKKIKIVSYEKRNKVCK